MKLDINKNSIKNSPKSIFEKRKYIFWIIFLLLLTYNFNIIYQNAYLNLIYVSNSGAINFLDGKRENEKIKELTEDLKNRKERIESGGRKKHKNYFIFEEKTKINNKKAIENNCVDCGAGGWQIMNEKCGQAIFDNEGFRNCLVNFGWLSVNQGANTEEIKNGYIKIGNAGTFENSDDGLIKVFIYRQWAADESGNLYLFGQAG